MESTKQAVTLAYQGLKPLRVYGYRSTDGEVQDITVTFATTGVYNTLVQESVKSAALLRGKNPTEGPDEAWEQALDEQVKSWNTTLSGEQPVRNWGAPVTPVDRAGYGIREDRPTAIFLTNLQRVSPAKEPDISRCRTPVTAAKKIIHHMSPVSTYLGTLILEPGKFDRVEVVND